VCTRNKNLRTGIGGANVRFAVVLTVTTESASEDSSTFVDALREELVSHGYLMGHASLFLHCDVRH
jgi:hypothetical protein